MKEIILLTDHRNYFYSSIENLHDYTSMDVEKIVTSLNSYGYKVKEMKLSEIDFEDSYLNKYILYQSTEDKGSFYKSYIEDIILALSSRGATLLPAFEFLRAHHNKNYMELIRLGFNDQDLKTIKSKFYGNSLEALSETFQFPVVVKTAEGSGSLGVKLARNNKELLKIIRKLGSVVLINEWKDVIKILTDRLESLSLGYKKNLSYLTPYRKKIIIQNFIPNLDGDYKVLYFSGKYYTLYRENRENDFRASGSGKLFSVPDEDNADLLDFAEKVVQEIDYPLLGMDIGFDGTRYHLLEFQVISFGTYTLQASEYWYEKNKDK